MPTELTTLIATAAAIGVGHTLMGPDHYLPFIAMAKARRWSLARSVVVTVLCGIGHVLSSVALGTIGIALGWAVGGLEAAESFRGELAAWCLTAFGLAYMTWGLHRAFRGRRHTHRHIHADASVHAHEHSHEGEHVHVHDHTDGRRTSVTPWALFVVFLFGPCEPLIPILMYPAAAGSALGVALVTAVFGVATIGTMVAVVLVASAGLRFVRLRPLERYSHALAGAMVLACAVAIHLGL
jgi:sulfite exporter TauE/SafE